MDSLEAEEESQEKFLCESSLPKQDGDYDRLQTQEDPIPTQDATTPVEVVNEQLRMLLEKTAAVSASMDRVESKRKVLMSRQCMCLYVCVSCLCLSPSVSLFVLHTHTTHDCFALSETSTDGG